ncbi:Transcription elongation factor family protein [Perilla frutescens var. frutescens]|nr:Transcription elongation factor family protein [Perilla frutescens var. frutescens]
MSSQPKGNQFDRKELLKIGKNKKKKESYPTGIALLVESVLAELHVAVEEDAELNRQEKPAITKLRNLSLLTDIIPRKHLQQEFLDRGVLDALREWLEPLPDGSIPSIDVRATVLKCLNDEDNIVCYLQLTIDLEHSVRRDQMKSSGIGKAVMFYYKYEEETTANRKLAKALVEKWCRVIFRRDTAFEDIKNQNERTYIRPPIKKGRKSGPSSSSQRASRPEAMLMDFVVRPQSKVDPEAVRARAKRMVQDQPRAKLSKKLEEMRAPKRKQLQAVKPSADGCDMVKYL